MDPLPPKQLPPGIPSSVLEFQRSASGGAGGGLHFQYDIPALAAAAAAATSDPDEVVKQLREDGARLTRRLAHAQAEGKRLQEELGREQGQNQRLTVELDATRVQSTHYAQQAREVRHRAEEQLRVAHSANKSLEKEVELARRALELERSRTLSAVSSIARLRAERDALRAAQVRTSDPGSSPSTSARKMEAQDRAVPMEGVEMKTDGHFPTRAALLLSSSESPAQSPPSSPAVSISSAFPLSPLGSVQPSPFTSPRPRLPPLTSASPAHRPSAASFVPRPSLPRRPTAGSADSSSDARLAPATSQPKRSTTGPAGWTPSSSDVRPTSATHQPRPALPKRPTADSPNNSSDVHIISATHQPRPILPKRATAESSDSDSDIRIISAPSQLPALRPSSSANTPGNAEASGSTLSQTTLKRKRSADEAAPKSKSKLGITHLPLLYETRGDSMFCRSCRRAFPGGAGWLELAGHSQEEHADACAEVAALGPAQVVEQQHKLQYLGKR
ncbi:hypothetical protein DFH09DRAFT_331925 [Mycena vulgaris]|nr:hypothetical protein DFH09DRAFT_331925 [Mycena vulgaris]